MGVFGCGVAVVVMLLGINMAAEAAEGSGQRDETPLMRALVHGSPDEAERLIRRGADVNARTEDGITPLMIAIALDKIRLAGLLLDKGATVDSRFTPLTFHLASTKRPRSYWLQRLAPWLDQADGIGRTPLSMLMAQGGVDVPHLFQIGLPPERAVGLNLPTHLAAQVRAALIRRKAPSAILDEYKDLTWRDRLGDDPDGVQLRKLARTAPLNLKVGRRTLLDFALDEGDAVAVKTLLERASPDQVFGSDSNVVSYLESGLLGDDPAIADLVFDRLSRSKRKNVALALAAEADNLELVKALLARGLDPRKSGAKQMPAVARARNPEIVLALLEAGAEAERVDPSVLYKLAENGDDRMAERLLAHGVAADALLPGEPVGRQRALAVASSAGVAKSLLNHGADPRPRRGERSALDLRRGLDDGSLLRLFVEKGGDLEYQEDGLTPLLAALWRGNLSGANSLLDVGANGAATTADGKNGLHGLVASDGYFDDDLAARLVAAGAAVNQADNNGNQPAHMVSSQYQWRERLDWLRRQGADLSAINADGENIAHILARSGLDRDLAAEMREWGVEIDRRNWNGATPLLVAAFNCNRRAAESLIQSAADITIVDNAGRNLAFARCDWIHTGSGGEPSLYRRWIDRGVSIDQRDRQGMTPLLLAAHQGAGNNILLSMIKAGADVTATSSNGRNVLHHYMAGGPEYRQEDVRYGEVSLMADLIGLGVPVDAKDKQGDTPFLLGAAAGIPEAELAALVRAGANPRAVNNAGSNFFHLARYQDSYPSGFARSIAGRAAMVNARDREGMTPLSRAVLDGAAVATIQALIELGAKPELTDRQGRTALHLAVMSGSPPHANLLGLGGLINRADQAGMTPLAWAAAGCRRGWVAALLVRGARGDIADASGVLPIERYRGCANTNYALPLLEAASTCQEGACQIDLLERLLTERQYDLLKRALSDHPTIFSGRRRDISTMTWAFETGMERLIRDALRARFPKD